jgi:hypothetical protein
MRLRFWRRPFVVVDVHANLDKGESYPYESFLAWCRCEGIDPEDGRRCEVYRGLFGPYAIVSLFKRYDDGSKVPNLRCEEFETYRKRVTLWSLPPSREI